MMKSNDNEKDIDIFFDYNNTNQENNSINFKENSRHNFLKENKNFKINSENKKEDIELNEIIKDIRLTNSPITRRIKNSEIEILAKVDFQLEKEKMKSRKKKKKYVSNSEIESEIKEIEEHFINSQRDKKPILYDEEFYEMMKTKKSKEKFLKENSEEKENNSYSKENKENNSIKKTNFITNNSQENIIYKIKNKMENENENVKANGIQNNSINELNPIELDKINTKKEINFQENNFLSNDNSDVMVISNLEDKMTNEQNLLFMDKPKVFIFINKKSGSQEGTQILGIAGAENKNFDLNKEDKEIYNEYYNKIIINKIKNIENKEKQKEEIYVFSIDLLEHDKKIVGIERLKNYTVSGKQLIYLKTNELKSFEFKIYLISF